jgi:[ribosomal protein S5]-alanine N-acetyltransferase
MLAVNFNPFPVLATPRLTLRQPYSTDRDDIFRLRSNTSLMRFIPRVIATSPDDATKLIQQLNNYIYSNEAITWAIERNDSPGVIGTVAYIRIDKDNHRAEIGYMLAPEFHGQGIMDEAIKAAIDYGFDKLKLHSIEALVNPLNEPSGKVLINNGFLKTGTFKDYLFFNGGYVDVDIFYRVRGN